MTPSQVFFEKCRELVAAVERQQTAIQQAAEWFAETILSGRMVHVFGSGHSRIMVEEMWPRYGSFPGFNPIVELSLTFHNLVVGANGQRQTTGQPDRKSTRLNSSHGYISYAVFCLKKKKT